MLILTVKRQSANGEAEPLAEFQIPEPQIVRDNPTSTAGDDGQRRPGAVCKVWDNRWRGVRSLPVVVVGLEKDYHSAQPLTPGQKFPHIKALAAHMGAQPITLSQKLRSERFRLESLNDGPACPVAEHWGVSYCYQSAVPAKLT